MAAENEANKDHEQQYLYEYVCRTTSPNTGVAMRVHNSDSLAIKWSEVK